jgi:ABC-type multidrug transport system ATPase subunit
VVALDSVSFGLANGDIVALIGPNGSGKSTLIGILSQNLAADSGFLSLFGRSQVDAAGRLEELLQCCGVCFQDNVLIPQLSVRQHLALFGSVRGMNPSMLNARVEALMSQLLLASCQNSRADSLSGGQKRKLCVAIALLANPPILILDEPTAGVDFQSRQLIWKVIAARIGSATFLTSHALEEAESVCNKIFVLRHGQLVFQGSATELRRRFNCGYVLKVVDEDFDAEGFKSLIATFIPEVDQIALRHGTFVIPVDDRVGTLLASVEERKADFGVTDYTFAVESLDEVFLRITQIDDHAD